MSTEILIITDDKLDEKEVGIFFESCKCVELKSHTQRRVFNKEQNNGRLTIEVYKNFLDDPLFDLEDPEDKRDYESLVNALGATPQTTLAVELSHSGDSEKMAYELAIEFSKLHKLVLKSGDQILNVDEVANMIQ